MQHHPWQPLRRTPNVKILIVDDSLTARMWLTATLKHLGHDVVAATDGLEAWNAFQRAYYPVVITDWHMPKMDGLALSAMIRARPHEKYSYVILITSDSADVHYEAGIK